MPHKQRRIFVAEMSLKYCGGSPRKTESVFGWGREMVAMGLGEKRTGICCISGHSSFSGNIRWEERHPEVAQMLRELADSHAQQDSSFTTEIAFTRLTAEAALKQLRSKGIKETQLPANGTMAKILNRMGYRLRPVEKAKPKKKLRKRMPSLRTSKKKILKIKKTGQNALA